MVRHSCQPSRSPCDPLVPSLPSGFLGWGWPSPQDLVFCVVLVGGVGKEGGKERASRGGVILWVGLSCSQGPLGGEA